MRLMQGDCLKRMEEIEAGSVDLILCDLPYGTTACKWDVLIAFEPLWYSYQRVLRSGGAVVLTACQPFTSALVMSNPSLFRYELVWEKPKAIGFLYAKKRPLACHESILVFAQGWTTYNPQKTAGKPYNRGLVKRSDIGLLRNGSHVGDSFGASVDGSRYPRSVLLVKNVDFEGKPVHPTQKPVALMEYLIRTYTLPGQMVLDNCMGSGTTGVACVNTRRKFIGIELDPTYFEIAQRRIAEARQNFTKEKHLVKGIE